MSFMMESAGNGAEQILFIMVVYGESFATTGDQNNHQPAFQSIGSNNVVVSIYFRTETN